MAEADYSDLVWDHFDHPRHSGALDESSSRVGTGRVDNPFQDEVLQVQIEVIQEVITAARFKAHGGVATLAAASLVTEWLEGRTLAEAAAIDHRAIAMALDLPVAALPASILAEAALRAALADYAAKQL
ncbi:MAG TPA: iron-sulfur cluster assembly scaffold protein [Candidatus Competibacteraceae bacterium]|nr:iron-sulfur cluster assembly scaffold protein [Candidatus Competibacteraceae bacterium]